MKKFLLLVIMAVAAVFTMNAQDKVKEISIYGERPNADSYREANSPKSTQAIQYGSFEADQTLTITTKGVPVEYWYKHDQKQTFLVILTGKNENVTLWFTDGSDFSPVITWDYAIITNRNGQKITVNFERDVREKVRLVTD